MSPRLRPSLGLACLGLLAACQPALGPPAPRAAEAAADPIHDCDALLRAAVVTPQAVGDELAVVPLVVGGIAPRILQGGQALAALPSPPTATGGCFLLVAADPGSLRMSSTLVGRSSRASSWQTATRRRANPDYQAARAELRDTEDDGPGRSQRLASTGDIGFDLLGLALTGVLRLGETVLAATRENDAEQRLAATPRWIEEPVFEPYRLELREVAIDKQQVLHVALMDAASGRARTAIVPVSEQRRVQVADNLDPADRHRAEGKADYLAAAELTTLATQPPPVERSVLLTSAADALAASPLVDATTATLALLSMPSGAPVSSESAGSTAMSHPGIVRVGEAEHAGLGIYVRPDQVLTARSLVADSALVRIEGKDGFVTHGITLRVDATHDLALVHVQRPGRPVQLATGPGPAAVPADAAPGTPLLLDGRLAGIVIGSGAAIRTPAGAVARFVGDTARTDARP